MAAVGGKGDEDSVERLFSMVLEELTCPICFEEFEEPKSLPYCAHNICTPCLNKMIALNPNVVVCPQCRVESPAWRKGADDFPTNTLLVRLLLSTPKREKQAIRNALGEYKKGLESAQSELDWMKRYETHKLDIQAGATALKQEISQYVDKVVEKIRAQERKLCSEVDTAYSSRVKRLENKLNERKMSLQRLIDQGNAYVKEIEKTLNRKRNGTDELENTKTVIVEQLHEFLAAVNMMANKETEAATSFDLQFVKGKCHSFHLGKVSRDSTLSQKPERPFFAPQTSQVHPCQIQRQLPRAHGMRQVPCHRAAMPQGEPWMGLAPAQHPQKYKISGRVPNPPAPGQVLGGMPGDAGQAMPSPEMESLTPSALAQANPTDQKQMLGEKLFPLIQQTQPELAGKITGMLLELDNAELLHMLESRKALLMKVEEAVMVLQAHYASCSP